MTCECERVSSDDGPKVCDCKSTSKKRFRVSSEAKVLYKGAVKIVSDCKVRELISLDESDADLIEREQIALVLGESDDGNATEDECQVSWNVRLSKGTTKGLQITQVELSGNSFQTAIDPGESQTFSISADEPCTVTRGAAVTISDKKKGIVAKLTRFRICESGGAT